MLTVKKARMVEAILAVVGGMNTNYTAPNIYEILS